MLEYFLNLFLKLAEALILLGAAYYMVESAIKMRVNAMGASLDDIDYLEERIDSIDAQ